MAAGRDPRRDFLLDLLHAGLAAVAGRARMRAALAARTDLHGAWVLAAGKAACAMTLGVLDALGARVERALVVTRQDCIDAELLQDPRATVMAGGHPLPDATSLAAGEAALELAGAVTPGRPVLLLVSGGASSLLESLPAGVSLESLQRFNDWALGSGRAIGEINAVRRRLSRVKDGRLLEGLSRGLVEGFFISDVPGDDPSVVGSGLLARADGTGVPGGLPEWVLAMTRHAAAPDGDTPAVPLHCVGRLDEARAAITAAARRVMPASCPPGRLDGDAVAVARTLCVRLKDQDEGLLVLGGETTVVLPREPGLGGRNQHLALAAAMEIAGRDDLLVLAVGSDGSDGSTQDAGALVDGGSVQRGQDGGLDAARCLSGADSGRFLEASGDLVHTGATGTNVGDLVLALRWEPGHSLAHAPSM